MFTMAPPLRVGASDPFSGNVVSLLPCNGTNGSTTFTDLVPGRTWAVGDGTPTVSTAQSKFGGASILGSVPGYISAVTPGSEWVLSGDYSIEGWIRANDNNGAAALISIGTTTGAISLAWTVSEIRHNRQGDTTIAIGDGLGTLFGRWVHVYIGRQGTTNYVACNGVMASSISNTSIVGGTVTTVNACSQATIGGGVPYLYIDDMRVTSGVCRYTASFTPPTAPLQYP